MLGTPGYSLAVVIIAMIWMGIPFFAIMILAALQSIPADVYEAADVDGCGTVRQFFQITLPYIKPTLITTVLLRTIWIFNSLDLVVIITDGGPANSSQTLPAYMYSKAFGSYDFGFAAALGVMLMIILGLYALIFLKVTNMIRQVIFNEQETKKCKSGNDHPCFSFSFFFLLVVLPIYWIVITSFKTSGEILDLNNITFFPERFYVGELHGFV